MRTPLSAPRLILAALLFGCGAQATIKADDGAGFDADDADRAIFGLSVEENLAQFFSEDFDRDGNLDVDEDQDFDFNLDVDEDANNNGVLDPGEDQDGDGNLDVDEDQDGDGNLDFNEDFDGDGVIDVEQIDLNGDGVVDGADVATVGVLFILAAGSDSLCDDITAAAGDLGVEDGAVGVVVAREIALGPDAPSQIAAGGALTGDGAGVAVTAGFAVFEGGVQVGGAFNQDDATLRLQRLDEDALSARAEATLVFSASGAEISAGFSARFRNVPACPALSDLARDTAAQSGFSPRE
jgi:hypothetical protein